MWQILTLALSSGQLLKIPVLSGYINLLDTVVILLVLYALCTKLPSLSTFYKNIPPFAFPAGVFISIALLSLFFSPLHLSFNEYMASVSYTLRFGIYIFLGILIYKKSFGNFRHKLNLALISAGVCLSVLGLLQLVLLPDLMFLTNYGWDPHYFRTVSTFLDPNFLGGYLVITLILSLAYKKTFRPGWLFYVSFITVFTALVTTFSRGAGLMLFTSFIVYAALNRSVKLFALAMLLTVIFVSGYFLYIQNIAMPRNINKDQSAQARFDSWKEGVAMFNKSPLFGVGFNSYKYALREYNLTTQGVLSQRGATSNDSSLLFTAATTGIAGLIGYLYFIWSIFKTGYKIPGKNSAASTVLISVMTGLMLHSLFTNSLFYPFFLLAIIMLALEAGDINH